MRFPRGNNRNRPLKQRLPVADLESPQEVERVFRRFWKERQVAFRPAAAEEGRPCA